MVKKVEVGEIINIGGRDYVINLSKVGNRDLQRINIKLLEELIIKKTYRKVKPEKRLRKRQKILTLRKMGGIE